jgi:hypothetical protein
MSSLNLQPFCPSEERNGAADTFGAEPFEGDGHDAARDAFEDDDELRREMERLAAEHRRLLSAAGVESAAAPAPAEPAAGDLGVLVLENDRLRGRNEELKRRLKEVEAGGLSWEAQQKEYEALLEEKSEVIRSLHVQVQQLHEQVEAAGRETNVIDPAPQGAGPDSQAVLADLERQRRQLRDDEEAVEEQMRQMELGLSRERVEIARQRAELQRLQLDLKHELEVAAREETLRERLAPLQRRHQDIVNGRGAAAPPPRPKSAPQLSRPGTMPQLNAEPEPAEAKKSTSIVRRLFGGGK